MENLIISLAKGENISEQQIKDELYDICDRVHASCDERCPAFYLNGNKIPDTAHDFKVNRGCDCFKDGGKMLDFIRNH